LNNFGGKCHGQVQDLAQVDQQATVEEDHLEASSAPSTDLEDQEDADLIVAIDASLASATSVRTKTWRSLSVRKKECNGQHGGQEEVLRQNLELSMYIRSDLEET